MKWGGERGASIHVGSRTDLIIFGGQRQDLYKKGGLISVTSRILVVDMLQSDIPLDLITGIVILHAEKYGSLIIHHTYI